MSVPLLIPFNNNPESTSVKTTSYTIPAGKFARVRDIAGNLTLNSSAVYSVIDEATATFSANNITTLYLLQDADLFVLRSSSTVSNASNKVEVVYSRITNNTANAPVIGNTGFIIENNNTFTGTRISFIKPLNSNSASATYGFNSTFPMYSFFGLNMTVQRVSGTVSGTLSAIVTNKNEFWVASGTVLDGNRYLVTEYNNIS